MPSWDGQEPAPTKTQMFSAFSFTTEDSSFSQKTAKDFLF
jgi:hypothetical protein